MRRLTLAALLVLLAGGANACPIEPLRQAALGGDLAAAVLAMRTIEASGAACPAEDRYWAGRLVATLHGAEAESLLRRGAGPSAALAVVEQGLVFGRPWRLLRLQGELLARQRDAGGRADWAAASLAVQAALNDTLDQPEEPRATQADIERLIALAEQFRMNATRLVRPPATRNGEPGGLDRPWTRAIGVVPVAQPIHFVWGTARFTELGQQAADALAETLAAEGRPRIRLIGHTDPDGPDEFNMRLSFERAEAVRRHLLQRGYPTDRIAIDGRGEREPVPPVIAGLYMHEEYHQVLRRVVLERVR
jgi:outer membrane protein OmpA-like peptidoglycan-associated protein